MEASVESRSASMYWKLWKDPPNFFGRPAPALRELLSIGTRLWYHDTTQMTGGAKP
jgi:hypothetical protein